MIHLNLRSTVFLYYTRGSITLNDMGLLSGEGGMIRNRLNKTTLFELYTFLDGPTLVELQSIYNPHISVILLLGVKGDDISLNKIKIITLI